MVAGPHEIVDDRSRDFTRKTELPKRLPDTMYGKADIFPQRAISWREVSPIPFFGTFNACS
jgi:hypothetical protein